MTDSRSDSSGDMTGVLGLARHTRRRRKVVVWLSILIAIALAGWLVAARMGNGQTRVTFETAEVTRGDLTVYVTATGTLQPLNQVDVGTEISGTVETVAVDFNDHVRTGQLLARLNTDQLSARLRQSEAAYELAQAKVEEAQATLAETQARYERLKSLVARAVASQDELDAAQAAYNRAAAGLKVAEDQVNQAHAQVDADRTTLGKAEIRSPIDGIVLKRQVEVGQTVAASLQTPVLFTVAENLAQMELNVAVDEADVGQVRRGQAASFSVDAFPGRTFPAVIDQVRFSPQTVQGVVTYETVLLVDNSDLSLRPGMTATVAIVVGNYPDVVLVPNSALRFVPPAVEARPQRGGSLFSRLFPRPARGANPANRPSGADEDGEQHIWVLEGDRPVPVPVEVGATDGSMTQVLAGDLQPGTAVIVDISRTPR